MNNLPPSPSPVPAGGGGIPQGSEAPTGSPASQAVPANGLNEAARAQVGVASKLLMQTLPHLTDPEEQKEVLQTITKLNRRFGKSKTGELENAQLIKLLRENQQGQQGQGMPEGQPGTPQPNPYGGM